MIVQPDLDVLEVLATALEAARAEPEVISEIFAGRPVDEQQEILTYFASREIPVRLSYPRDVGELPGYYIDLGQTGESLQPIGQYVTETQTPSGPYEDSVGSLFESRVQITCVAAENVNIPIWMAVLAKAALLRYRGALQQRGLLEQVLQATGYIPVPQLHPNLVFRRDVILAFRHFDTVTLDWPQLREIAVTGEAVGAGDQATYSVHLKG